MFIAPRMIPRFASSSPVAPFAQAKITVWLAYWEPFKNNAKNLAPVDGGRSMIAPDKMAVKAKKTLICHGRLVKSEYQPRIRVVMIPTPATPVGM